MIRNTLSVLLALALAGCGFHLRDKLALPEDSPPVQVRSTTPYSELVTILERSLRNAGVTVVPRGASGQPEAAATAESGNAADTGDVAEAADPVGETGGATGGARMARLDISSERWGNLPIAIDERGRAQEFSLRYATVFTFRLADGRELVPRQVVELSRDYVSQPTNVTGTSTEREILADELRREMAASILRRIDSVVRANLARAAAAEADPASEAAPVPEATSTPETAPAGEAVPVPEAAPTEEPTPATPPTP
jgi:LPS-assembly lipoprotein